MNRLFWKKIQYPFWCMGMYPLLFICWLLSNYKHGWPFYRLWEECVRQYWIDARK